jgi:hypothetical protein
VFVIFSNKKSPKFQVSPREMDDHNANGSRMPVKLRTFVELTMDVASASPRRYFFEARCCMFYFPFIVILEDNCIIEFNIFSISFIIYILTIFYI